MSTSVSRKIGTDALSVEARRAAAAGNWPQVRAAARDILARDRRNAEGHFLLGLAAAASARDEQAAKSFSRALSADAGRYDAAVELAALHLRAHRHGAAIDLLAKHEAAMQDSPRYLDMAGTLCLKAGLPGMAQRFFERAYALQPGADVRRARLASCYTFVGRLDEARALYAELLEQHPAHQQSHYELSKLATAGDDTHVQQMKRLVEASGARPADNIYLLYAIGKELEDLEEWDEAFDYYERAGRAAADVGRYDVAPDIELIDAIIETCDRRWYESSGQADDSGVGSTPIFVTGLPRSGTTLVERILACHSKVESAGESFFVPIALRRIAGSAAAVTPEVIRHAATVDFRRLADDYRASIDYRLSGLPYFVEKLPENFLHLGFIAKAFPGSPLVHVRRDPMDNAFALFKQSYFRYAYRLEDLARYLVVHSRLARHWHELLGDRLVTVDYEQLVSDQECETRRLLEAIGIGFEDACLRFESHDAPTNTASAVQVREKMHSRSVGRWRHFARHLAPLEAVLRQAGG